MKEKNKEEIRKKILRRLSVDARVSMRNLADCLKTSKVNAYGLFNELSSAYGIKFVPEINIDNIGKWEFIKKARLRTKRGILSETVEEFPETGFNEYIMFVKFVGGLIPTDDEIMKAIGKSFVPQFVAKIKGEYNLVMYLVSRSYEEALRFGNEFGKKLDKYKMLTYTDRVWGTFGFFPLSVEIIEQFDIFDTYKNLLLGLSKSGRSMFSQMGREFDQGPAQMLYAYDRLIRTEILRRVTYYEEKPKCNINTLLTVRVTNAKAYEESKDTWFLRLVKEYNDKGRANECVFMCDVPNPKGMLVIGSFESHQGVVKFIAGMITSLKGVEIIQSRIGDVMLGHLGIRDFDMQYAKQYKSLAMRRLVPRIDEKPVEIKDERLDDF